MSCPIASRLFLSCLLPCALLAQDKVRVALYDGPGTSGSIANVKRALADCADFEVAVVSAEAIAAGGLKGFHVVLHPGGSGGGQGRALGEAGREAERRFLAEGGGYVGICAGAYLATCEYPWSLHVLDAKVVDRAHWARGKGAVEVALSPEGQALLGLQAKQQTMAYLQGPLLAPAGDPAVPDFTSLATYATEIAEKGAPKGVMVGTTAVATGTFQKGRVACFSPHPERTEAQWPQLHKAVRWVAGRSTGSATLAQGVGTFRVEKAAPGGADLVVHYARPASWRPSDPVVVVMHGVNRNADTYRDNWVELAERHRLLVLAPEFSRALFPTTESYNYGNMRTPEGKPLPRSEWAFGLIDRVFETARSLTGATRERYLLFGHSAGAQFVHRFVLFGGSPRLELAISANAGWYTFPEPGTQFPYGLGGTDLDDAALRAALQRPMVILLGDRDIDPNHKELRHTPEADRQGAHRLARGQRFFEASQRAAQRLGAALAWRLHTVAGSAHENDKMAQGAMALLTPGKRP